MPLQQPLPELQTQLRNFLLDNPADALKALLELLPAASDKAETAGTLLGELNDTNKQRLRGTLTNEELQRAYNRIRAAVLDLIDGLTTADFDPAASGPAAHKGKQGELLYRIPDTMPLQRETRCIVRIATDQEAIVADILLDDQVRLKSLTRISDLMQVELVDPSDEGVFRLRAINTPEQMVEDEGYTEWLFYVTPMREGVFPLLIKVAVIELLLGKERKKEIVLEEEVRILAENAPEAPQAPLKSAGEKLLFQTPEAGSAAKPPLMQDSILFDKQLKDTDFKAGKLIEPPPPAPSMARSAAPWKTITAVVAGLLLLGSTATWAVAPDELAWVWTRYVEDTPQAHAAYAAEYPQSRHVETAIFRKAELLSTVEAIRAYESAFPEGQYAAKADNLLSKVENRDFEAIQAAPTTAKVRLFIDHFPESDRLEAVQKIVARNDSLRPVLDPILRQKLEARSGTQQTDVPLDSAGSLQKRILLENKVKSGETPQQRLLPGKGLRKDSLSLRKRLQ